MRIVGTDYIDYWQNRGDAHKEGGASRIGVRVRDSQIRVLMNSFGDEQPHMVGNAYPIPVDLENLPSNVWMIVDDHILNCSNSDLLDVLLGRKSFEQALDSTPTGLSQWRPHASYQGPKKIV